MCKSGKSVENSFKKIHKRNNNLNLHVTHRPILRVVLLFIAIHCHCFIFHLSNSFNTHLLTQNTHFEKNNEQKKTCLKPFTFCFI